MELKLIDANRGTPPGNLTAKSFGDFQNRSSAWVSDLIESVQSKAPDGVDAVNSYGLDKPITKLAEKALSEGFLSLKEGEEVLFYQNTVNLWEQTLDRFINAVQGEQKTPVVFVEDPSYDRVLKTLDAREQAGAIRVQRMPFLELDGRWQLDKDKIEVAFLSFVHKSLANLRGDEVPIVYRTPVNNPTGINTSAQDAEIAAVIEDKGGLIFADHAYHWLSEDEDDEDRALSRSFTDSPQANTIKVAQFSKITGQNLPSISVWDTNNPWIAQIMAQHRNANFTDFNQEAVARLHWVLTSEEGRALLLDYKKTQAALIHSNRDLIASLGIPLLVDPHQNHGYFSLLQVDPRVDYQEQAAIAATYYQEEGDRYLRLAHALTAQTIEEVGRRLQSVASA